MRVLLVEDDDAIAVPLVAGLELDDFEVERVRTCERALAAAPADLVLLDLGLPDGDGRDLLRRLRKCSQVPVIMVTASGDERDLVAGLNLGADDYVVKPFGFDELVARMSAVMRRAGARHEVAPPLQRLGAIEVDRRAHVVTSSGKPVSFTPKEYAILELLARDPGSLVSRQSLLDHVWGRNWYGTTKMIDVHVASLRRKLAAPELIETVRGLGYRLVAEP
jgi:two-component system, OmpR family, response regulator RegX3